MIREVAFAGSVLLKEELLYIVLQNDMIEMEK
jgi:hypothetical protein